MDPLSLTTAVITLLGTTVAVSRTVNGFIKTWRDAKDDMIEIKQELTSLELVLELLRDDAGGKDDSGPLALPEALRAQVAPVFKGCEGALGKLQNFLAKYEGKSRGSGLKWAVEGKKEANAIRMQLSAHRSALDLALVTVNLVISTHVKENLAVMHEDIKDDTAAIREDTEDIRFQMEHLQQEIVQLRAQLSTQEPGQEVGNPGIQQWLDGLASYAETVAGDDVGTYAETILHNEQEVGPTEPAQPEAEEQTESDDQTDASNDTTTSTASTTPRLHGDPSPEPTKSSATTDEVLSGLETPVSSAQEPSTPPVTRGEGSPPGAAFAMSSRSSGGLPAASGISSKSVSYSQWLPTSVTHTPGLRSTLTTVPPIQPPVQPPKSFWIQKKCTLVFHERGASREDEPRPKLPFYSITTSASGRTFAVVYKDKIYLFQLGSNRAMSRSLLNGYHFKPIAKLDPRQHVGQGVGKMNITILSESACLLAICSPDEERPVRTWNWMTNTLNELEVGRNLRKEETNRNGAPFVVETAEAVTVLDSGSRQPKGSLRLLLTKQRHLSSKRSDIGFGMLDLGLGEGVTKPMSVIVSKALSKKPVGSAPVFDNVSRMLLDPKETLESLGFHYLKTWAENHPTSSIIIKTDVTHSVRLTEATASGFIAAVVESNLTRPPLVVLPTNRCSHQAVWDIKERSTVRQKNKWKPKFIMPHCRDLDGFTSNGFVIMTDKVQAKMAVVSLWRDANPRRSPANTKPPRLCRWVPQTGSVDVRPVPGAYLLSPDGHYVLCRQDVLCSQDVLRRKQNQPWCWLISTESLERLDLGVRNPRTSTFVSWNPWIFGVRFCGNGKSLYLVKSAAWNSDLEVYQVCRREPRSS